MYWGTRVLSAGYGARGVAQMWEGRVGEGAGGTRRHMKRKELLRCGKRCRVGGGDLKAQGFYITRVVQDMKRGEYLCRCIWVPRERVVYGMKDKDFKPENQARGSHAYTHARSRLRIHRRTHARTQRHTHTLTHTQGRRRWRYRPFDFSRASIC